jgi:hypothetical protein
MTTQKESKKAVVAVSPAGSVSSAIGGRTVVSPSTLVGSAQSGAAAVVAPKGFRAKLQQMLLGWQAVIAKGSALSTSGGSLLQGTVVAQLQTYLGAYAALDAATLAEQGARATVEQQEAAAQAYFVQLKEALVGFFGSRGLQLAQFGLKPKRARQPLPAAKKATMVVQMLATRKLRGVVSKSERAALKAAPVTVSFSASSPSSGSGSMASPVAAADPAQDSAPASSPAAAPDAPTASK